jgi:hypothetical protein
VSTQCIYMVRAVKLEVSGSGSYYNASQGIFQDFHPPAAPQMLVIAAQSASKDYGAPVPALTATYSGFVNGDTTNSLTSQAVLSTGATATSPPAARGAGRGYPCVSASTFLVWATAPVAPVTRTNLFSGVSTWLKSSFPIAHPCRLRPYSNWPSR